MEEEGPRPIERVLCLPEKSVKDMMNSYKKEKGTSA
jgi:hypothetical protein